MLNVVLLQQMQEAAGAQLDATINERVTQDLNVSTEERKGGEIIDVR